MKKNFKNMVLCMALSASVLVSGNSFKYFNIVETVKAEENVKTTPEITNPNGASISDAPFNKAGYALDPNADRYTFGVWQFLKTDKDTGNKTYYDYYATLSVDRNAITGDMSANPDVHLRIVKKSDGSEVFSRTIKAGTNDISLPSFITNNNADVTNTLTYTASNGKVPGNVTFSLVNANLEYETLQIRDTEFPGNENEDKPNVQTSVPAKKPEQTTYYRVVDKTKYTEGQVYNPTGEEEVITKYTQKGISGQQYVASENRDIEGYKRVAASTDNTQQKSGILKEVVGSKLVELQGGANHYYVKRISETVDSKGSTVTKFYALDPSEVDNFTAGDIGTTDVSKYTLIYTSKVNAPGEEWKSTETKVTKINSKNGDYYINVNETAGSKSLIITGWQSNTEKVTLVDDATKQPKQFDKPFTKAPDASLTPAGKGNNNWNLIAGRNADIVADSKVTQADGSITYVGLKGFSSFSNNYSIPTPKTGSLDVNYYFYKIKEDPEIPVEPNKPEDPKPEEPGKPEDPKPEEPGKPEDPKPEEPGKPEDPKPEEPGKPEDPKPEEPGKPEDPKPEEPGKPKDPKPEEPGKPEDPKPRTPEKPRTPNNGTLPKTSVASSSELLSLAAIITGAMGVVISSKKRK